MRLARISLPIVDCEGGDAITLDGTDKIRIDDCKFSLVGRQMLVSGWGAADYVTTSNNEFDGTTTWSASCTGKHCWNMLFLGIKDYLYYTFVGNYVYDFSGRAPVRITPNPKSSSMVSTTISKMAVVMLSTSTLAHMFYSKATTLNPSPSPLPPAP